MNQDDKVLHLVAITEVDYDVARACLVANDWQLERVVNAFAETGSLPMPQVAAVRSPNQTWSTHSTFMPGVPRSTGEHLR